jgi:nitrate/TMAO reductase-like tetraheme cytochrome c subunit
MWLEKRPELSKAVNDWMVSYNFRNCRGCHNLADMYNAKNPMVAKMHAGFIDKPTNCIMCHKTAGHNYKMADEIIKATGKWPDPAKAWEQADAAAKK